MVSLNYHRAIVPAVESIRLADSHQGHGSCLRESFTYPVEILV